MAVTILVEELLAALRLGTTDAETAQGTRLLAYATEAVQKYAPGEDVPVTIQNEAVVRLSGYLFDSPPASRGAAYANALRNSGAAAILAPYRVHRAGSVEGSVAAVGPPADVDQTARDAAGRAQDAADRAQAAADEADIDHGARDAVLALTARVSSLEAAIAALPSGGDAGEIKTLFAVAAVEGGWQEITLTEEIPENTIVEFRLGGIGQGPGEYGLATSSAIAETTPVAADPGDYSGALPMKSMDADDLRFGQDVILVQRSDESNKLWVRTGRELATTWQIKAFPMAR